MATDGIVVVVGVGEVGRPLLRILARRVECQGVDIRPVNLAARCSVLHVCYPFEIRDFVGVTAEYIHRYEPSLTILHSTVAPGTTRKVQDTVGHARVAYSPVRGKHVRMEADMLRYKKFVGAFHPDVLQQACEHLQQAGFATASFKTPEIGELSKLVETTYLGVLVAWAQQVERFAELYNGTAEDVNAFIEEIDFLPSNVFPGYIGGHCVMPNISILQAHVKSQFLDAVVESNELKRRQLMALAAPLTDKTESALIVSAESQPSPTL